MAESSIQAFHTVLGHLGARWLAASATRPRLAVLTTVGLLPLVFFKLFDFFVGTVGLEHLRLGLVLPLGISFYTFSVLGYLVDVYRGREEPLSTMTDVALFVAFWPHYTDFSGYSDMAIGFALLLGFALPANFNYPYNAVSLTDFWRRWHISLSSWFRDYLYIPLGGSRHGLARACASIMVVFVLSGIWHGAGWSLPSSQYTARV